MRVKQSKSKNTINYAIIKDIKVGNKRTSTIAEYNVPLKVIIARVGHKDSKTTMEIYTHVTKNMKTNVVDILDTITRSRNEK